MEGDRKVKKIKVNKEIAKFFKLLGIAILISISIALQEVMFGIMGCTSLTPTGRLIEIMMIIMFLVLTKIVKKPDINNANGNEQQQSHGKNKEDESSLLFLMFFIFMVLICRKLISSLMS